MSHKSDEREMVGINGMEIWMQAVFGWVRNLTGFFLFMSVMNHLMPEKTYGEHIRLFSGLVFILLVLQPVVGHRNLDAQIARYYESSLFRYETGELKENLLGIEKKQRDHIVNQYKQALAREVSGLVRADGFETEKCHVEIEQDSDSGQFGKVMSVQVEVSQTDRYDESEDSPQDISVMATEAQIEIPKIAIESGIKDKTETETSEKEDQRLGELRDRISSYCGVEEQYVEIRILEEKR